MQTDETIDGVSVVIPAYNEADSIQGVVGHVKLVLASYRHEIIVVNDGSDDTTATLAESAGARVISNPANMGYGFSLKRGFQVAAHECVIITDADGTYPIDKIPALIAEYKKGYDMVVGARQGSAYWSSVTKSVARLLFKWMSEYVVGRRIPDVNSGFRAIRKSRIVPVLGDLSNAFSFSTSSTLIFILKKYFVTHIQIEYHKRSGKSKVRHFQDALRALEIMVVIIAQYNPIKLFLLLSAIPFSAAVICFMAGLMLSDRFLLLPAWGSFLWGLVILAMGFFASIFKKA